MSIKLARLAARFAESAHTAVNHRRKNTKLPYFTHLEEVAEILYAHGCDWTTITVGFLHDVLEDTPVTYTQLYSYFGTEIADYVVAVSDVVDNVGIRAERVKRNHEKYAKGDAVVHNVKVADMISNLYDICEHDPQFAKVYLTEKIELLKLLTLANKSLVALAWKVISNYQKLIAWGGVGNYDGYLPTRAEIHGEE